MKVTDPVCCVQTDTERAVAQEDYGGRTFYFCSAECHRLFKTSPEHEAIAALGHRFGASRSAPGGGAFRCPRRLFSNFMISMAAS